MVPMNIFIVINNNADYTGRTTITATNKQPQLLKAQACKKRNKKRILWRFERNAACIDVCVCVCVKSFPNPTEEFVVVDLDLLAFFIFHDNFVSLSPPLPLSLSNSLASNANDFNFSAFSNQQNG